MLPRGRSARDFILKTNPGVDQLEISFKNRKFEYGTGTLNLVYSMTIIINLIDNMWK